MSNVVYDVLYKLGDKVMFHHFGDVDKQMNNGHPLAKYHGQVCVVREMGANTKHRMGEPTYYIGRMDAPADVSDCIVYQYELMAPVPTQVYKLMVHKYTGGGPGAVYTVMVYRDGEKMYSTLGYPTRALALEHATSYMVRAAQRGSDAL